MARGHNFQAALCLCLVLVSHFHFTTSKPTGFSLKLIPRDSPDSPLYPGKLTESERIQSLLRISEARNMKIGSEGIRNWLFLDTGGSLIWTQCLPCKNCYKTALPIYNSQTSNSYRKLPCDHQLCSGDNALFRCVGGECRYDITYGDGRGITRGVASTEAFELFDNDERFVEGVIFGCSNENIDIPFAKGDMISGIFGLSMSPASFANQPYDEFNGLFSYCLVPFSQTWKDPSYLNFGTDVPPQPGTPYWNSTKFVIPPGSYFYYLNLLDITVGPKRMKFPSDTFAIREYGEGGCIIDSGTIFTQFDDYRGFNVYGILMEEFQKYYDAKKLERHTFDGFELCYKMPPGFNDFARMIYHLDGADYEVEGRFVHYISFPEGYFCVAIRPGKRTVIGAWHQQNIRLVYNINKRGVSGLNFYPDDCATLRS
ncbi:unnamed protein product [Dovyalis caffra]|uniref:Peptidase A1 domain-containing protein n=1 Tax=Dovyalis caffra TaxID=77055 RepID=A0AAV1RNY5_9ROSI|nr:unnamed protein product [Dovyalis caffra]